MAEVVAIKINKILMIGTDDDLFITITIIAMENLKGNDKIYVKMTLDEESNSKIHSTFKRDISFLGVRVG